MSENQFKVRVYQQDNDNLNELCQPATEDWLEERLFKLGQKLGLSPEQFDKIVDISSINSEQILNNSLQNPETKPEVLFFPGGKSTRYSESLKSDGANKIRNYVNQGGMYYGICAGAFYASKQMTYYSPDKKTNIKNPKTKTYQDEENPILGIVDVASDGDPEVHYGKDDPKIKNGGFVEVRSNDGEVAFVFASMHLLGPFMKATEEDKIKGTAQYGKHIYQNELAGAVAHSENKDVSIIGFHPEMTPTRIENIQKEIFRKTGVEIPILMADGRNYDKLSKDEKIEITEGCNRFSDNAFLPDLFNKFCNHLKDNFSDEIDLEKVNKVQEDLQKKIDKRPIVRPEHSPSHRISQMKQDVPLSEKDQQRLDSALTQINSLSSSNPKETKPAIETPKQAPKEEIKHNPIQTPKPPKS